MDFDVVGVGHICCDFLGIVPFYPEVDQCVWMNRLEKQGGGAVSQALVTLARLGAKTAFIGAVGDDDAGRFLWDEFIKEKVNTDCLTVVNGERSSTAFVVIEKETGKRTIFVFPGAVSRRQIDGKAQSMIASAKYLHLDATQYETACEAAVIARANRVRVSLDGCEIEKDPEKTLNLIRLTDILIANERYPCAVTGIDNLHRALQELAKMGPQTVLATVGKKGCLAAVKGEIIPFPAYSVPVIDTTGAGDVFHGAFLFGLLQEWPLEQIVKFASATSAINCLSLGGRVGIPTRERVMEFIREQEG